MVEASDTEWQVVSRKKGGKATNKKVQGIADSPNDSQPRKQPPTLFSPSSLSCRSRTSTKVPTEAPCSLPESPAMDSSWSETSTDAVLTSLDDSALDDEFCSMQESSSRVSLEIAAASDACTDAFECAKIATVQAKGTSVFRADAPAFYPKVTQEAKEQRAQRNHKGVELTNTLKSEQGASKKSGRSYTLSSTYKQDATFSSPVRKRDELDIPPLGSAWVHNGSRDESAEWRLVNFQPMWEVKSRGCVHLPVSVQTVDARIRVVIKRSFLSLEPVCDQLRVRSRSLDTCFGGERHCPR
mmetsp:Transcript_34152/g.54480  ORF Transcript_34152/g.54480 Transcript_34152/m.54480 type:complete len:298 (+) Transcript_34152:68-961(+)